MVKIKKSYLKSKFKQKNNQQLIFNPITKWNTKFRFLFLGVSYTDRRIYTNL